MKLFKVIYEAGAFIDNFHYGKDEIVAYDDSNDDEPPMWGVEVDETGEEVRTATSPLSESADAKAERKVRAARGAAQALADNAFRDQNTTPQELAKRISAPNPGTAQAVAANKVLNEAADQVMQHDAEVAASQVADVAGIESGVTPEPATIANTPEAARAAQISDALGLLDHGNDAHWTQSGLPSLDVLKTALGYDVARKEVDAGFKRVVKK